MKNYKFKINGTDYSVDVTDGEDGKVMVGVNGNSYEVEWEDESAPVAAPAPAVKPAATAAPVAQTASAGATSIKSPLPGRVLDVFVKVGDTVTAGQHIVLLEAMKMENNIDSDLAGTVKEVRVQRDASVMEGDVLVVIG